MVGLVRGFHGVRGGVRVETLTDEPSRFAPGSVLHPEGSVERLTVVEARPDKPGIVVRFAEVPTRDAAEALLDTYLEADPAELPPDTYYWHDVVGCRVETTRGEELGTVDDVMRVGEAEVYLVRGERGEVMVPAVRSVVVDLAPAERRIVVDGAALGLDEG